jgi:glutaredoxin
MNFTVYTKDNCPYCYKVKQVLELTGTKFSSFNLNEDFTREEFYDKFGEGSTIIIEVEELKTSLKYLEQKKHLNLSWA